MNNIPLSEFLGYCFIDQWLWWLGRKTATDPSCQSYRREPWSSGYG